MSIQSVKELFRTTVYEVNKPRKPERSWVVVLNDNALTGTPFLETGLAGYDIDIGKPHPVYSDYRIRRLVVTEGYEGSPYHVHVKAEYDILYDYKRGTPTARDAVWSAESSPGEVPALSYYDSSTLKPLTNSAGDYFPGLVTQEANVVATYEKNYATWPSALVNAQNFVNSDSYAGCAVHSLKVVGVTVTPEAEDFNNAIVRYWKAVVRIHYRQSGHNLQLPDIGWNFISSGQKRRAMVFDFENSQWVPSPNPVGLNGSGAISNVPAVLNRRVNPEVGFAALFGTFPTTPPALATS
jgi:hypothetical protein